MQTLILDGHSLTISELVAFADDSHIAVALSDTAKIEMQKSRDIIEEWVNSGEIIYGITTGFGEFSNVVIPRERLEELQENLIISHSAGIGSYLERHIVRGMMILRINALAKGCSGIRISTVETLIAMLAHDLIPAVPSQGSVGSSGDLAPLAHIALALIGKGEILMQDGTVIASQDALKSCGIKPVTLQAKEGLALINGTQMMTSLGAFAVHRAKNLIDLADIAGALSIDANSSKAQDNLLDFSKISYIRFRSSTSNSTSNAAYVSHSCGSGRADQSAALCSLAKETPMRVSRRGPSPTRGKPAILPANSVSKRRIGLMPNSRRQGRS